MDMFLIYLPYWRVQAFVAGWMFGRVRKDKDSTKPVEVEVHHAAAELGADPVLEPQPARRGDLRSPAKRR